MAGGWARDGAIQDQIDASVGSIETPGITVTTQCFGSIRRLRSHVALNRR